MAVDLQTSPIEIESVVSREEKEVVSKNKGKVKFSNEDEFNPTVATTPPQPTYMAPVKPINLTVYTIDNAAHKMTFQTGRHTSAGVILKEMVKRLKIPEEMNNVFSIWLTSQQLQLQLKSYHVPVKLFKKWRDLLTQYTTASSDVCKTDQPILSFKRNAFLPIKEEKRLIAKKDSKVAITLLYHEAVFNVINGRYPLSAEEVLELAGLQCAVENREYDESQHTPDSMKDTLRQYFPAHMIPVSSGVKSKLLYSVRSGGGGGGLESDLCKEYEKAWNKVSSCAKERGDKCVDVETSAIAVSLGKEEEKKLWQDIDLQLKLLYLQRCWIKPYYGCVMFRGQVERKTSNLKQFLVYSDRSVVVAINPECIHIFKDSSPREIMLYLTYDLFSWDFQPATEEGENFFSSLWLEFDSTHGQQKVSKRLQIFSRQAPMMDAMISRCVDDLNKQDEELKRIRIDQEGPQELPMESIDTGNRSLSKAKNYLEDKLRCELYSPQGEPISHPLKSLVKRLTDKELSSPETTPTHQSSQEGEDTVL